MSFTVETIPFKGWPNVLKLSNGSAEIRVTLDVGPRILSYAKIGGLNPFNIYEDHAGGRNETVWRNRGGHRLWIAPESPALSYFPDNSPVAWEKLGERGVRLTPPPETPNGFQKQIDLVMAESGPGATVTHRLIRVGEGTREVALWALSVMAAGGRAVIPQPAFGEHPRDLLPNRRLILWPYTDLSDPRYRFGKRFFTLQQVPGAASTKLGAQLRAGWAGYLLEGTLFIKRFPWDRRASYPDDGCNIEVFTNSRMLELESLGGLVSLSQGQKAEHTEQWDLIDHVPDVDPASAEGAEILLRHLKMDLTPGGVYE